MIKKKGKLVITTGISGCAQKELFLPSFAKYCKKEKKSLKVYMVGPTMFRYVWENFGIVLDNETILQASEETMNAYVVGTLKEIETHLEQDLQEKDVVIVSLHSVFYWRGHYRFVPSERWLMCLKHKPDMFCCFIDDGRKILANLQGREQWKNTNIKEENVLSWQNIEVGNTRRYLSLFPPDVNREFLVIPVTERPEALYYLLFEPWRPRIYAQMPISHVTEEELERANDLIEKMWKHAIVFNPLRIETGVVQSASINDGSQIRHFHTMRRDTELFIPQVHVLVANYAVTKDPEKIKDNLTIGVPDETAEGSLRGKHTWTIFTGECSPFIIGRSMPGMVFQTRKEFLKFLPVFCKRWKERWEKLHAEGALIPTGIIEV